MIFLGFTNSRQTISPQVLASQFPDISGNEYQLYASVPQALGSFSDSINTSDARAQIIENFLHKHSSPLSGYGESLVLIADQYNLDFRLLPAIAMQESNLCKKIPQDSYNCWGFGIYGDKVTRFASFSEAFETVAKTIRSKYIDKGLLTVDEIQSKYTPSSNGSWARSVSHFMEELK